ncbi:MAG: hypothetical protein PHN80_06250 [Hespellia sp.]|nr:hypothetical protein [Hespellia sp.]
MGNFDEDIKRITNEVLEDGTIDGIIREKVVNGFKEAIDNAFRWGELNNAIKKRIQETMVPYIENYNMDEYTLKLETVLSEIIKQSTIPDQTRMIENFQNIMTDVPKRDWTLEEIFDVYKKFVAENINTDGMEVTYDDGVSYEYFEVSAEIEEDDDKWYKSVFEDAHLDFKVDASNDEENEDIQFRVNLSKYNKRDYYEITFRGSPDIDKLRFMSDFEVFLMKLSRYSCRLVGKSTYLSADIKPTKEPEPSFS